MTPVRIVIEHCMSWGYGRRFLRMKSVLESNLPDVEVIGTASDRPGAFEIFNAKTRKVYFSKLKGGGFPENDTDAIGRILAAIQADSSP